jgi:hypothetical protein
MMTDSTPKQRQLELKFKAQSMEAELKKFAPTHAAFWHDEMRGIANELTRCGLISTRNGRAPRRHFNNERLFTPGDDPSSAAVTYTGEELRGNDEDTFLTAVHYVREQRGNQLVARLKSSDFCKANGWQTKQSYYTEIYKSILRLSATTLVVMSRRLTLMMAYEKARAAGGSIEMLARMYDEIHAQIDAGLDNVDVSGLTMSMLGKNPTFTGARYIDENDIPIGDLTWEIPMDTVMVTLFARPWLTLVPAALRQKLSVGARRLLAYYLGHKIPYAVKAATLAGLLQLDCEPWEQKRIVKARLQELVDNQGLEEAKMDEGPGLEVLVHVKRLKWNGVIENSADNPPQLEG